jgi:hypothetical protein
VDLDRCVGLEHLGRPHRRRHVPALLVISVNRGLGIEPEDPGDVANVPPRVEVTPAEGEVLPLHRVDQRLTNARALAQLPDGQSHRPAGLRQIAANTHSARPSAPDAA